MTERTWADVVGEVRERERAALAQWKAALAAGDADAFGTALGRVALVGLLPRAFRHASRLPKIAPAIQAGMVGHWVQSGDSIRSDINDDAALLVGLRSLMPPYSGGAVTLYRGDSFVNRRRRSYGLAWTSDPEIARRFADGIWRTFDGGSVVLAAEVPAAAIICEMDAHLTADMRGEREFLVDRRRIGPVRVVERLAQISDEMRRATIEQS